MSAPLETRSTAPTDQLDTTASSLTPTGWRTAQRHTAALTLLVSSQFVVMLDTSIVNVALPSIQTDLALSPTTLTWVVNAYLLACGGLLLLSGRAADLFGRRRVFVAGSALFTLGTLIAATAPDQWFLVGGRVVQGAGAAALSPAAMSLLLLAYPGAQRARAMSIWGAASALGGAAGVMTGGLLCGTFGWSSVFFVTVPITAAAAAVAKYVLPPGHHGARRRFDWYGAAAITGAVTSLAHGALGVAEHGPTSPTVLASLAVSAALLAVFITIERGTADPLIPLQLFSSRILSTGVAVAVLGGAARVSTFVLIALYLQQALGMAPKQAGLAMVPTSITGFAFSLTLLPHILRRLGPQRTLVLGMVVLATGHLWLAHAPREYGFVLAVLPGLLSVAIGVALSFTPTTMVIASAAPIAHAGLASGLAGSATQIGAALGTATFTAIGVSMGTPAAGDVGATGFSAAFTAAAAVALATAALGASSDLAPKVRGRAIRGTTTGERRVREGA